MTSFLISAYLFHNIFISQRIKIKFDTEIQIWMLILISGSKNGFGDDFGQSDTKKPLSYVVFGQTPLSNSVTMATAKVPDDQKLFEIVCYMIIRKIPKFQISTPNGF